MSEFPSLAEVLADHARRVDCNHPAYGRCRCGIDPDDLPGEMTHAEHQANAWRSACTIRTVEELGSLPAGAAVLDLGAFDVFYAVSRPAPQVPAWMQPGYAYRATADEVPIPALLIWHPDWERP